MPPGATADTPCAGAVTLMTVRVCPGSGSVSLASTVMVLVPLSSSTVTTSLPGSGVQSIRIDTVASLLLFVPSDARYLKDAGPHAPAAGVNVNAPLSARVTVPFNADPGDSTARTVLR